MKIVECKQGSPEWHRAKLGLPSASQFHRIFSPGGKPSTQAAAYMNQLLAEYFTGEPTGAQASPFMQRGTALEDEARSRFEFEHDVSVQQVGVCLRDDGLVAASPDGLLGDDELLELKVPAASTQIAYLRDGLDGEYWSQCQGQLYVTERKAVTLYAYSPVLPAVELRIERDPKYIAALDAAVSAFVVELQHARAALLARGCAPMSLRLTGSIVDAEPF